MRKKEMINKKLKNGVVILVVLITVHITLLLTTSYIAWPEMMFWPYLILKGWMPYKDIVIAHTPLLVINLSLFYKLFGVGVWQLKFYTILLIMLTDVLLFYIAKRFWSAKVAFLSLALYIPFQVMYEGNGLWFDLPLTSLALLIYYLLRTKKYLLGGMIWGVSFFTKQTAAWFVIPITVQTLIQNRKVKFSYLIKPYIQIGLGIGLVFLLVIIVLWVIGLLPSFHQWAIDYGIRVLPREKGQISLPNAKLLLVSLIPFSILFILPFVTKKKDWLVLVTWTIVAFMGVYPRWGLFHFQPALPFLAISGGLVLSKLNKVGSFLKITALIYMGLVLLLFGKYFVRSINTPDRFLEDDTFTVSEYINDKVGDNGEVYIMNTWDNIYVFSNTVPSSGYWVPHLSWVMDQPGVQEKLVRQLENNKPEIIIMRPYGMNDLSSYKPELIDEFLSQNYGLVEEVGGHLVLYLK
ncbi:glycosyltransferase family 39 protein [Patescibacteria group bacterium]